jgi:hypothetical protein
MTKRQIALPFRLRKSQRRRNPSVDLIGRSYEEDYATVIVTGLCLNDDSRVMVRREPGGSTWSMPAWLMRLIFLEKKGKRAA